VLGGGVQKGIGVERKQETTAIRGTMTIIHKV